MNTYVQYEFVLVLGLLLLILFNHDVLSGLNCLSNCKDKANILVCLTVGKNVFGTVYS